MKRFIHIPLMLCFAFLTASCIKDDSQEWGSFDLALSADLLIETAVKAPEPLPETDYSDYTIMLYRDGSLLWETTFDEFTADAGNTYKRVPAGEYVVYVENCNAQEAEVGNGRARYAGSGEFTVTAGRTATATVVCRMINAKVTLAYGADFLSHFNPSGLSVSDLNGRKVALDMEKLSDSHENAEVLYFNVTDDGTAALTYTLVAGDLYLNKVMRYDVSFIVEKCMWNKVNMTKEEDA